MVMKHGPKVFDKARDVVNRRRDGKETATVYTAPEHDRAQSHSLEELSNQVVQMQQALSDLSASHQALSRAVTAVTQQNQQLAGSVRSLRRRVAVLVVGVVVVALVLGWKMWLA